jgi:hypothetical protein
MRNKQKCLLNLLLMNYDVINQAFPLLPEKSSSGARELI